MCMCVGGRRGTGDGGAQKVGRGRAPCAVWEGISSCKKAAWQQGGRFWREGGWQRRLGGLSVGSVARVCCSALHPRLLAWLPATPHTTPNIHTPHTTAPP